MVGGIAGLRLHLSTAPSFLCHSSEPEDNPRWRSIRELGSTSADAVKAGINRRKIPAEKGEQAVYINMYRLKRGWVVTAGSCVNSVLSCARPTKMPN